LLELYWEISVLGCFCTATTSTSFPGSSPTWPPGNEAERDKRELVGSEVAKEEMVWGLVHFSYSFLFLSFSLLFPPSSTREPVQGLRHPELESLFMG